MESSQFIFAKALSRVYRKGRVEVPVFRDLSFSVAEGEFVAIVGPSGSGKSTILNLIAGFDSPSSGQLVVDGVDLAKLDESGLGAWRLRTVGFVFQSFNLISVLTAFENVEFPLRQIGLSRDVRRERVERALAIVGLSSRGSHFPAELSGGEEQRVAIARAIVVDPKIIIADEPTGSLDAESAIRVLDILRILNTEHKKTIVLVTHDATASSYAGRKLTLNKGVLDTGMLAPQGAPAVVAKTS